MNGNKLVYLKNAKVKFKNLLNKVKEHPRAEPEELSLPLESLIPIFKFPEMTQEQS